MKPVRTHFLTLLMGFSQIYAWATTYYLPATVAQLVANEIGCSYFSIIGGFSWALLIGGLSAPKIGHWIDLEGGRRPLFAGSLLMGFGLIVLSLANGLLVWYLAWTLLGLGMALGLFNACFAAIGRLLGQESKKIIIRITLISGFATLFWPLTTFLITSLGWRVTVFLFAIFHILLWAPLFWFTIPKEIPKEHHEPPTKLNTVPAKAKLIFYFLAVYATVRAVIGTSISVSILSMLEGLGLTLGTAALVASLIGPSQIVGRLIEMTIGKNFDPINSSIFWTAILPLSILVLVIVGPSCSSFFAIAYGMSNGVLTITMSILPLVLFGSQGYARLLGKLALPILIAQAASPLLVAPLLSTWNAMNLFILAGVLGLVSLLCITMMALKIK